MIYFTIPLLIGCQSVPRVFEPAGNEIRPGVIILPTSGGVHHEISYAQELSRRGFQTIVADYHQSGYYDRIDQAYDKLRSDPRVGKIGIVGFSRGGYVAGGYSIYQKQKNGRKIDAIVGFYIGPSPPLISWAMWSSMLPPYLFLQGEKDNYTPPWRLDQFCAEVDPKGDRCKVVEFKGVGHAFDQTRTKSYYSGYDARAAKESYELAVQWLDKWLR